MDIYKCWGWYSNLGFSTAQLHCVGGQGKWKRNGIFLCSSSSVNGSSTQAPWYRSSASVNTGCTWLFDISFWYSWGRPRPGPRVQFKSRFVTRIPSHERRELPTGFPGHPRVFTCWSISSSRHLIIVGIFYSIYLIINRILNPYIYSRLFILS